MADLEKAIEEVEALVTTYADNTQYDAFRLILSANREMRTATPDLTAVIAWLKNGCDPAHAVTELQIYQDRIARSALTTQRRDGE